MFKEISPKGYYNIQHTGTGHLKLEANTANSNKVQKSFTNKLLRNIHQKVTLKSRKTEITFLSTIKLNDQLI